MHSYYCRSKYLEEYSQGVVCSAAIHFCNAAFISEVLTVRRKLHINWALIGVTSFDKVVYLEKFSSIRSCDVLCCAFSINPYIDVKCAYPNTFFYHNQDRVSQF